NTCGKLCFFFFLTAAFFILIMMENVKKMKTKTAFGNMSLFKLLLRREGFTVQVSVNDYLDIYCPHYNSSQRGRLERVVAEQYILYMVNYHGYRSCDPKGGSKRWECNKPHAPHAPIKFSEKFQRYSAFSLGYEFNVGKEYYYISTPTHHHGHSCLRLRVYVCCSTGESSTPPPSSFLHLQPLPLFSRFPSVLPSDEFNPEVPKLEKSVSGSSPSRDRLLLTVAVLLASGLLLS
uniref:Ephrin-A3a n=1 Tax=Oryzias sinensis TaxID=183150 RepID=A0A8C8E2K6_9TELE